MEKVTDSELWKSQKIAFRLNEILSIKRTCFIT